MSDQKSVPKGLRENEVERGIFKKPPIPYIPVEDEIGEKVKQDSRTLKVKLDDKTTVNAAVWTGGNPEGFLIHVTSALSYIKRSRLYEKWMKAKAAVVKCDKDLQDVRESLAALKAKVKKLQKAPQESSEESSSDSSSDSEQESKEPAK